MKELVKAIMTKVRSGGAASDLYEAVSSDFYYGTVPPTSSVTMPWITFNVISERPEMTFRGADEFNDTVVQFSIFDDRPGVDNIMDLFDKLDTVFHRAALTYDTKTHVGCKWENTVGPLRLEDCWMMTVDYRVNYK